MHPPCASASSCLGRPCSRCSIRRVSRACSTGSRSLGSRSSGAPGRLSRYRRYRSGSSLWKIAGKTDLGMLDLPGNCWDALLLQECSLQFSAGLHVCKACNAMIARSLAAMVVHSMWATRSQWVRFSDLGLPVVSAYIPSLAHTAWGVRMTHSPDWQILAELFLERTPMLAALLVFSIWSIAGARTPATG